MTAGSVPQQFEQIESFLDPSAEVAIVDGIVVAPLLKSTPGLTANAHYFGQPNWVRNWFECVHRYPQLRERWHATSGTWDDKVVVDVGCGPGNLFATLGGQPAALIGVDVARGSLEWAAQIGYLPLLADAHAMPLKSAFADIVALNGTLHHCDDMAQVLSESARLVKPGGMLVADHDPQLSAYDLGRLGKLLWNLRLPLYRRLGRGGHASLDDEQTWALATEIHHAPGDGVTAEFFRQILAPLGFEVLLLPHNQRVGAEVLEGERGRAPFKMRLVQRLSGIRPDSDAGALSLLCVATRSG
jgi:SAM-dependent methyltransferase